MLSGLLLLLGNFARCTSTAQLDGTSCRLCLSLCAINADEAADDADETNKHDISESRVRVLAIDQTDMRDGPNQRFALLSTFVVWLFLLSCRFIFVCYLRLFF